MKNKIFEIFRHIPNLAKYLFAGLVVGVVCLLLPTQTGFNYQFEKGQSWRYDDLKADFDFPILKSQNELKKETENALRDFAPYYRLDQEVVTKQLRIYEEVFAQNLSLADSGDVYLDVAIRPNTYRDFGRELITSAYQTGVFAADTLLTGKSGDYVIQLLQSNTAKPTALRTLYTTEEAKKWAMTKLAESPLRDPDFLVPLLDSIFVANLTIEPRITADARTELLSSISPNEGLIKQGELIVPRGGQITEDIYGKILSYQTAYRNSFSTGRTYYGLLGGYFLMCSLIMGIYIVYLQYHAAKIFLKLRLVVLLLSWFLVYCFLASFIERTNTLSIWMIPFAIAPIVIRQFFRGQVALFTHICIVLMVDVVSSLGFNFIIIELLVGIVALLPVTDLRKWGNFFVTIGLVFLTYIVSSSSLTLIEEGSLSHLHWQDISWFFLNAIFTLLAYPLIALLGQTFGLPSSFTLAELSDLNHPLLKLLSKQAPGTFQHSLQVANLSEAAALSIGADALLCRVASLYHDIGKTTNPAYFIENQQGENPHDLISPTESAKIIIAHVTDGLKLAKKNRLPDIVTNFIRTHHGTTRTEYFYRIAAKNDPDIPEAQFRYPGPPPQTKEETIVMIADSLEASSKSMRNLTHAGIDQLVSQIIADKQMHGQFAQSELSFNELEQCRQVFEQTLKSIFHPRIVYPKAE